MVPTNRKQQHYSAITVVPTLTSSLSNGKVFICQSLIKAAMTCASVLKKKKIYRYIIIRYSYIITASQKKRMR